MGNEQQGPGKLCQQPFQPLDGGEIQVVGGFVQKQQFRIGGQGPGQGHPLLGAAGQGFHPGVGIQPQAGNGFLHPAVQAPGVVHLQFVGQPGQFGHVAGMGRGVVGRQQPLGRPGAFGHGLEHRVPGRERRLLGHHRQTQFGLAPDHAVIRCNLAGQDLEQAGFARPIAADQADTLALVDD